VQRRERKINNCKRLLLKREKKKNKKNKKLIGFGWLFLRRETFCGCLEAVWGIDALGFQRLGFRERITQNSDLI
jgi:hypothetical protein